MTRTGPALGWLPLEAAVPGATLFLLLAWLMLQFLRGKLAQARHHLLPTTGTRTVIAVPLQRGWWSCTCRACTCLATVTGLLRRCCARLAS